MLFPSLSCRMLVLGSPTADSLLHMVGNGEGVYFFQYLCHSSGERFWLALLIRPVILANDLEGQGHMPIL